MQKFLRIIIIIIAIKKLIHYIIPSTFIVKVIKECVFLPENIVGENHIKL